MGGQNCADSLKEYVRGIDGANKDNTILFITGHSLGASTANVVGRLCGDIVRDSSNFVYTFASPNYETDGEATDGERHGNFLYYTNIDDVVPKVPPRIPPHYFSKIGREHVFNLGALDQDQRKRFQRAYRHFRGTTFEEDKDFLGIKTEESKEYRTLKHHLGQTYMSFLLSELTDSEIDLYLS